MARRTEPGTSPLSVHRAFVVHFETPALSGRRRYHGRVEHLSSGRATEFCSLDQLLGFVAGYLVRDAPAPFSSTDRAALDGESVGPQPATRRSR